MQLPSIAIIGGGILGFMTALQLTKVFAGTTITIYEQGSKASGASARSAGVHFPFAHSDTVRAMTRYSEEYYDTVQPFCSSKAIHPLPMWIASDAKLAELQPAFTNKLNHLSLDNSAPPWLSCGLRSATYSCRGAHFAKVHSLVHEISRSLDRSVVVHEGAYIQAIEPNDDCVTLRLHRNESVKHDIAILAPGPWSRSPTFAPWTDHLGLRIKRVVALRIPDLSVTPKSPLIFFPDEDAFLLPRVEVHDWVFSYTNTNWDQDPDTVGAVVTADDIAAGQAVLERLAPKLVPLISGGRVFCDTYTQDRIPVATKSCASDRLLYGGGANGSGYRLAPAMAKELVSLTTAAPRPSHN